MLCFAQGNYEPGKRHWLKVKKDYLNEGAMADTADLVVLGAFYGKGSKGKAGVSLSQIGWFRKIPSFFLFQVFCSICFLAAMRVALTVTACCSPSHPRPLQAAWLCCGTAGAGKH